MGDHLGGGLARFDNKTNRFINFQHKEDDPHSLSSNLVWSALVDAKGELWVGTDAGLDRLNADTNHFEHFRYNPNQVGSISNDKATFLLEDHQGTLWVSTWGGRA